MPFTIRQDLVPMIAPGGSVSLRDHLGVPAATRRTSLFDEAVPIVAEQNWNTFIDAVMASMVTSQTTRIQRELARAQAANFDFMTVPQAAEVFTTLWPLARGANALKNKKRVKHEIKEDIHAGYRIIAQLAFGFGEEMFANLVTFERITERNDEQCVIFSDHHFTNFDNMPNYFLENNLDLYLRVLDHYQTTDYCLVENGDVEDCILWEPNLTEATDLVNAAPWLGAARVRPLDPNADRWEDFMRLRYERRRRVLGKIGEVFGDYYDRVQQFRLRDKYVRLSGNHDTYTDNALEADLLDDVTAMTGGPIFDVLRLHDGPSDGLDNVTHVVMHGHQVDTACLQHGEVPWAMALGEMFSESLSWAFQGPDRFWKEFDARKWHVRDVPDPFNNRLAVAEAGSTREVLAGTLEDDDPDDDAVDDLVSEELSQELSSGASTSTQTRKWFEAALGSEIAWEYFELDDAFEIFALEVVTGEDQWKLRHMAEEDLCEHYVEELVRIYRQQGAAENQIPRVADMPKVVLGHTHEVRQLPTASDGSEVKEAAIYLNSGSAGRFAGLIWAIEIDHGVNRVISWSETEDGQLRKITWVPMGDELVHGQSEFF